MLPQHKTLLMKRSKYSKIRAMKALDNYIEDKKRCFEINTKQNIY